MHPAIPEQQRYLIKKMKNIKNLFRHYDAYPKFFWIRETC